MNFVVVMFEVARQTLLRLLQKGMLRLLAVALLGLGVLVWFLGIDPPHDIDGPRLLAVTSWWLLLLVLLPLATLYLGVQAVHGDIEDRTFQYLFVRPVPRAALLLGKWLAVSALGTAIGVVGVLLLYAGTRLHGELWSEEGSRWTASSTAAAVLPVMMAAAALIAVAYAAVAACFSALFRWPLVLGAGFVFAGQLLLGQLPSRAGIRTLSIADPVRRLVLEGVGADARFARLLWPSERSWNPDLVGEPLQNLAVLVAIALGLALAWYARSEYDSRERE